MIDQSMKRPWLGGGGKSFFGQLGGHNDHWIMR